MEQKYLEMDVFQGESVQDYIARLTGQGTQPMGIVVAHTHWDREWYLPFEGFRARLVATLDDLLTILENDPAFRSFLLDGQAIMLEDYLEVRPEAEPRLRRLVEQGRIKVGPWYTATDTFLPDPESIVRNLQLGRWASQRIGGQPTPVGYMPDLFGFSAQIPQILKQFGIETALAWRGFDPPNAANTLWWESPDGSRVLTLRPHGGYSESALGAVVPQRFIEEILPLVMDNNQREPYPSRLFMMGSDHFRVSDKIPWVAEQIEQELGFPVIVGSLEEMAELVRPTSPQFPVVKGEQRSSNLVICPASYFGTRIPLKQANQQVEARLLGEAEPLQAMAELVGGGSDRAHLRWAWRMLTQNHPHDSIPGCSIDEVHREMQTRFARAAMITKDAAQRGARRLARALNPATRGELGALGIVSLVGGKNRLRVRLHGADTGPIPAFRLLEPNGQEVSFKVLGQGQEYVQYHRLQDAFASHDATSYVNLIAAQEWVEAQRIRPRMYHLPWVEIELEIEAPKAGYRILHIEQGETRLAPPVRNLSKGPSINNSALRVWVDEQGLFVEHKASGRQFGPVYFSHAGELGDEYTACPLKEPPIVFTPDAARASIDASGLAEKLVLPISVTVPARMSSDRKRRVGKVKLTGKLEVSLLDNRVDLTLSLLNQAKNYDLRLVARVPGGVAAHCGAPYAVENRPLDIPPDAPNASQKTLPDFPFRGWVAVQNDEGAGLAVLARGLYEAAVRREAGGAAIALTLLRGVDALSRNDLETRPEHAGPMIMTPDAQCLGEQRWELALLPFNASEAETLPSQVEQFLRPAFAFPVQWSAGNAPAEQSLFSGDDKLVSSALKPAEVEEGVILHLHNPTSITRGVEMQAERVRLDETPAPGAASIRPFEVTAWKFQNRA